jgi:outer membrane protein OmpA-like peptidoglycan-associated protein
MKIKILTGIFLYILSGLVTTGYSQQRRLAYAESMYDNKSFYYASEGFEDVLERGVDSLRVAHSIADSYFRIAKNEKAVAWYRYLEMNNKLEQNELLRLALLEHQLGNASASQKYFENYEMQYGSNDITANFLSPYRYSLVSNDQVMEIELIEQHLMGDYSEIGAVFVDQGRKVLITSNRRVKFTAMRLQGYTGKHLYHLYMAELDSSGQLSDFSPVEMGNDDLKRNVALGSYSKKFNYLFFAKNRAYSKGDGEITSRPLQIYRAKINENQLEDPQLISMGFDNYSFTNPFILPEGNRLFFSSNIPGGYGGMDLYYIELNDNGNIEGKPVNLGEKINTSLDETAPFLDLENGRFFFSSNGHYGFGGIDIFSANLDQNNDVVGAVQNMGAPVNSSFDDHSLTINPNGTGGFFSSDRMKGKGEDDLFGFKIISDSKESNQIEFMITSDFDQQTISGMTAFLRDSSGAVLDEIITDDEGKFDIVFDPHANESISFESDQFERKSIPLNEMGNVSESPYEIRLTPTATIKFRGSVKDVKFSNLISDANISIEKSGGKAWFQDVTDENGSFISEVYQVNVGDTLNLVLHCASEEYDAYSHDFKVAVTNDTIIDLAVLLSSENERESNELTNKLDIQPIHFDFDSAIIKSESKAELQKVLEYLKNNPQVKIEIQGHTDSRGSENYNLNLSAKRAKAVKDYLVTNGVDANRLETKAFGESAPIFTEETINSAVDKNEKSKMHESNRRTNFMIETANNS